MSGGGKAGDLANQQAQQAATDEATRQAGIRSGTTSINSMFDSQFTPDFYDKQQKNYVDYAQPQLDQQHANAEKQLTFSLARGGNLDSSVRAQQEGQLAQENAAASQGIKDQGNQFANDAKNNVETARQNLISTLDTTGDATGAATAATNRAEALAKPPAYSPVVNAFADITSGLGQQAAAERSYYYGGGPMPSGGVTGMFGVPRA